MCFNYSINKDSDYIQNRFDAEFEDPDQFERIYHVSAFNAPRLPVINNKSPDKIKFFQWGLIPFWVKNRDQAEDIRTKTINARAETLFEKPSFREPIRKRRCLVIMDGFFEWREVGGQNYPHYIKMKDDRAFAVAGIWDAWDENETGTVRNTYSIITTEANPLLEKIHNKKKRMPAILRRADEKKWVSTDIDKDEIESIIEPYPDEGLEAYPIKRMITKDVDDNVPELLEPYGYDELKIEQKKLF
ncbi:MAG: SOS response-associated peptidase [Thermoplasmatota archaeon]